MKYTKSLVLAVLFFACSKNRPHSTIKSPNIGSDIIVKPCFTGGDSLFNVFIRNNILLPNVVKNKKINDEVWITFWVMKDGTVNRISAFKPIRDCSECTLEAIRLISIMPKWSPAYEVDSLGNKIIDIETEIAKIIPFSHL